MDILRTFNISGNDYAVNIQGTDEDPLFQANQIGRILNINNIHATIKDFDDTEKVLNIIYTLGGLQETTFLTEVGLYRLLGMSRKPIARTFQKWIYNVAKEIRLNGKYELQKNIEIDKKLNESRLEKQKHELLLEKMNNKKAFYLTRIYVFENSKFIIKIGWTNDIQERNRTHRSHFGSSLLLDVFECNENIRFEEFVKKNVQVACYAYTDPIHTPNGDVNSTETLLVNIEEYNKIILLIKKNIDNYQGFNHEQYIEIEKIKLQNKQINLRNRVCDMIENHKDYDGDVIKILATFSQSTTEVIHNENHISDVIRLLPTFPQSINTTVIQNEEEQEQELESDSEESTQNVAVKSRNNVHNRKIQQYDPNTFDLIETYDGLMDAIRKIPEISKIGLKTAALENKIYNGYRWFFISKSAEHIKYEIPPTIEVHHSSVPKLIAILNKDKSRIENVCASQANTAEYIGIKRKTTIHECIKSGKVYKNMYFSFFNDCEESLRNEYQSRRQLPICNVIKGTKIQQIDVISKNIIKTYESIADVLKHNCIARENVKRACVNNEVHNGYLWKYA